MSESDEVLTPAEVQRLLKISRTHTYFLISSGVLESFRVGRACRVRREVVDAFMRAPRQGAHAQHA